MSGPRVAAELRRLVRQRADNRCEYCLIAETDSLSAHQVDHILARKHGGETTPENLALSCVYCNQRKGSDASSMDLETRKLTPLFNPRYDQWEAHFRVVGARVVQGEDLPGAERHIGRAIQHEPENQSYLLALAQVHLAHHDPAAARRTLEPLRLSYVDPQLRARAEEMLKALGQPSEPGN